MHACKHKHPHAHTCAFKLIHEMYSLTNSYYTDTWDYEKILDCRNNTAPKAWLGDGKCDAGQSKYNDTRIYFNCTEKDMDSGDCAPTLAPTQFPTLVPTVSLAPTREGEVTLALTPYLTAFTLVPTSNSAPTVTYTQHSTPPFLVLAQSDSDKSIQDLAQDAIAFLLQNLGFAVGGIAMCIFSCCCVVYCKGGGQSSKKRRSPSEEQATQMSPVVPSPVVPLAAGGGTLVHVELAR